MMSNRILTIAEIAGRYDQMFARGELQETESFYRWVLKRLAPSPGATLLDISCGEGHLLRLAHCLYNLDVWGIDISTFALRKSRQNVPSAKLVRCDGISLPFPDNAFQYVTNLGSLEHYVNIMQGIREVARVLRPEGWAAILLPNSYYIVDIIWKVGRTGYSPSHQQPLEHFATVGEWKDMLTEGGISVMHIYAYNFLFPKWRRDFQWFWKRPRRCLYLLVKPLIPFNLSYCFLFVGRKRV